MTHEGGQSAGDGGGYLGSSIPGGVSEIWKSSFKLKKYCIFLLQQELKVSSIR